MVIVSEFLSSKIFLQKDTCQIGMKKFFVTKKVKSTVPKTYVINDINVEIITGTFYEKELQKTNQKELEK